MIAFLSKLFAATLIAVALCIYAPAQTADQLGYFAERIKFGTLNVKRDALAALRRFQSEPASRIAAQGLSDESEIVRATAINAVVFLPRLEASELLVPYLKDESPFIRKEAALALAEVGAGESAEALIDTMNSDSKGDVRAACAFALGKTQNIAAVAPLTSLLSKKPKTKRAFLRRSAARSIGQLAEFASNQRLSDSTPESYLPEKYKSAKPGEAGSPVFRAAVIVLQKVLANRKEAADTRREAAFALGSIGDDSSRVLLSQYAVGTDYVLAEICREAILKLSKR